MQALRPSITPILSACVAACLGGCAASSPLRSPDPSYPASWPAISHIGPTCEAMAGTYTAQGLLSQADDAPDRSTPVQLLDMLAPGTPSGSDGTDPVTLSLTIDRRDSDGSAFCTLGVSAGDRSTTLQAFCIDGDLALPNAESRSEGLPYLYIDAQQTNLWLSLATDGSLIIRSYRYHAGIALVVPYTTSHAAWARFARVSPR